MIEKIKTICWFLGRPYTYSYLFQLLKRRLFLKSDEKGKDNSVKMAKSLALSTDKAIFEITQSKSTYDFFSNHSNDINLAVSRINDLPFTMGGAGDLNFLYNIVLNNKPINILETGVAYGWSSFAILSAINENGFGHLTSVDMPYPKMNNERYVGIAIPEYLKGNWTLIRKPDRNGLIQALKLCNHSVDLIHYDSDKSYSGRKWAFPILWNALNPKGIFISDDIQDNIAFFEFCIGKSAKPVIIKCENKFVGVLRKQRG